MIDETKEQLLIRRVFKSIARNHFKDHKLGPYYCETRFLRGLGEDIANYVQAKNPKYYHKLRKEHERRTKEVEKRLEPNWSVDENQDLKVLMDRVRETVLEQQSALPHIHSCDICFKFSHFKAVNESVNGMSLYPRRNIDGMDEYWEEHKDHLEEMGKFSHIPYQPLICKELITEDKNE
jgi:hypothetical protein